jgi:glycosyltransferase involved in cell wall biosynthesis
MNILIMPSWYPGRESRISGIFVREQVEALSAFYPEHNFIVSYCESYFMSISNPKASFATYRRFLNAKKEIEKPKPNFAEFYTPVLTWTEKLNGETSNLTNAHNANFKMAESEYGHIDLIHAHVSYPAGYCSMNLSRKFKIPYIITEHMGPFPFEQFFDDGCLSPKISEPMNHASKIISVSNYSAAAIESFNIQRPVVIPNMVDENTFFPSDRKSDRNGTVNFLTVTSFTEGKGVQELMRGILNSDFENLNIKFTIAGSGPMESYVKDFIRENSLGHIVKLVFDPQRDVVVDLFQSCDAFILPSRLESFGIVFVEALACGKPVIATDCGGPADYLNEENGILIPVGDPASVTEAINAMARSISTYDSTKIREFFLNNFSRAAVCPKLISVYQSVTGK